MSTFSQFTAGNRIKSIQRGTIWMSSNDSSATATIDSVDTTKTELRMLGFSCSDPAAIPGTSYPRISLTSSTQITVTRTTVVTNFVTVSWELTEFF